MVSAEGATVESCIQDWLKGKGISPDGTNVITLPDHKIIIAIDFGTTNSGYAFVVKDTDVIQVNSNWGGRNSTYFKVPTCVLLDENMRFQKFGLDAQDTYADLEDDQAREWLYFERFKMELYSNDEPKKLSKKMKLKAANGKEVPALRVFSEVLRAIWNNAHDSILNATKSIEDLETTDILWVITVPAIWNNEAKAFMREAAQQAELITDGDENRLFFALEPEAASIYCSQMPGEKFMDSPEITKPETKEQQIVIDAGGGTVDITVHETDMFKGLGEVHRASGGPWGGHSINKAIWDLFKDIFGEKSIHNFKKETPNAFVEQGNQIEGAKVKWKHDEGKGIRVLLERGLVDVLEESVGSAVKNHCQVTGHDIQYKRGYLNIGEDQTREMFDATIDQIVKHVHGLLHHDKVSAADVHTIYLVGGFALCEYLQHRVKDAFEKSGIKVLIPLDSSTIVVKGAVLFGKNPSAIKQRIARFSYGARVNKPFREGVDRDDKRTLNSDGNAYCSGRFHMFARKGQVVTLGSVARTGLLPHNSAQTDMTVTLYASTCEDVEYTTDAGCTYLGRVSTTLPQAYGNRVDGRCEVVVCFGLTEIHALVIHHKTLNIFTNKVDFLTD